MPHPHRQVEAAQEGGDRHRNVGPGGDALGGPGSSLHHAHEQGEPLVRRQLPARRHHAGRVAGEPRRDRARRGASLPVTPSERRSVAKTSSRARHGGLPRTPRTGVAACFHRDWKVSPCGAGKSR